MTIAKFLGKKNQDVECELLFIDECSTVSNADMVKILEKAKFKQLILVGDTYQIEAIQYGTWFNISRDFLPKYCLFELKKPSFSSTACTPCSLTATTLARIEPS